MDNAIMKIVKVAYIMELAFNAKLLLVTQNQRLVLVRLETKKKKINLTNFRKKKFFNYKTLLQLELLYNYISNFSHYYD